ncbi:hypothetical protein [Algirhabdus cladophorae]|uniref:hypothetical protein n=1 Tax=Algirhabdus cladophorae TaxID=3377108 RepID=UPI003B84688E
MSPFSVLCLILLITAIGGTTSYFWSDIQTHDLEGDVIRGLGVGASVLGSFILWLLKQGDDQAKETKRKQDRQRRLLVALHAEIEMHLEQHMEQFTIAARSTIEPIMLANVSRKTGQTHSMPVGVVPKENDVFDRMKSEIMDLPDAVIGKVIRYYQADEYVSQLIIAFTESKFEGKALKERKNALKGYFNEGQRALYAGINAYEELAHALKHKQPHLTQDMQKARSDLQALEHINAPNSAEAG